MDEVVETLPDDERLAILHALLQRLKDRAPHLDVPAWRALARVVGTDTRLVAHRAYPSRAEDTELRG